MPQQEESAPATRQSLRAQPAGAFGKIQQALAFSQLCDHRAKCLHIVHAGATVLASLDCDAGHQPAADEVTVPVKFDAVEASTS